MEFLPTRVTRSSAGKAGNENMPLSNAIDSHPSKITVKRPGLALRPRNGTKQLKLNEDTTLPKQVSRLQTARDYFDKHWHQDVYEAVDYQDDINKYLASIEGNFVVDETFIIDKKVTAKMRSILVDWLVQVHQRFHLLPETLHLSVFILDRFIEQEEVVKQELQLLGTGALFISCKYEEIYMPECSEFEFISDGAFTKKELIRMENRILKSLGCQLSRPQSLHFLRFLTTSLEAEVEIHSMSKYFLEICLLDAPMSAVRPSVLAMACCWLSLRLHRKPDHEKRLPSLLGFMGGEGSQTLAALVTAGHRVARAILRIQSLSKLKAVDEKYDSSRHHHASRLSTQQQAMLSAIAGSSS